MQTAFVFDLDGTLIDSVYQHVLAWYDALREDGIELSVWRIHRKIGMSGGLFTNMLLRETDVPMDLARVERLQRRHGEIYRLNLGSVRPLPGARELLQALGDTDIRFAIATSGHLETARASLEILDVDLSHVPVITRDDVKFAKPDPDLFLRAADRLAVGVEHLSVVGDSVWDMLAATRARCLGIGLLSGGYGLAELESSGAYRVFDDPADLLTHLDEVGGRQ